MKVKKFLAPTMPEAMQQIRKDLGSDAVILNSKEVQTGGILGLFKKRKIEVVAALDPEPIKRGQPTSPTAHEKPRINMDIQQPDPVMGELQHLKKLVEAQTAASGLPFPPDYQLVYQHLIGQEVTESLARKLIDELVERHHELDSQPSPAQIKDDLGELIRQKLEPLPFKGVSYSKQVIQFAGPTGVGKTTTIAKIAAECVLQDQKKVAFITQDTYRIAAIEQLKTYARILDVPVAVTYNQEDYQTAIAEFRDYDLILVDTAGRNFRDNMYIHDLQKTMKEDAETYLVLSLTAKADDIKNVYQQFRHIPLTSLIMTKLDETRQYGSMLNLMAEHHMGIAYLTNGQDVPDDLFIPTPDMISQYITGGLFDA